MAFDKRESNMALKKVIHYFKQFENEHGDWVTFAIFASDRPKTAHGVSTIVPLSVSVPPGKVQTNHIVTAGGAAAALRKAISHLDSIYPPEVDGYEKIEDDL